MITLGAKVYFGFAAFALVAAAVLGLASGGSVLGILSFGWSGAVGDHIGYTVLLGIAAAAFFLGVVTTAFRDADPQALVEVAGTDSLPEATPPTHLSPWPVVAAFGVAALLIGLVVEPLLLGVGILLLAISAVEWSVTAWADRATGDPEANRILRNRIMQPVEIPAVAVIGIAIFVFFASRMLLALSKWGAIAVFSVTGAIILAAAALIATRPAVSRGVMTAVLLLGGVTLVVGGVVGIGAGEREFHHVGAEDEELVEHDGVEAEADEDVEDGVGAEPGGGEDIEEETGSETENPAVDDDLPGDTEE